MKINGYEIVTVCANYEFGIYGDIYDNVEDCRRDHPDDEIIYGYSCIPNNDNKPMLDWAWTLEGAVRFTYEMSEDLCW